MQLSLFFKPCSECVKTVMASLLAAVLSGCGGGGSGEAQAFGPAPIVPPTTPGPDPFLERQWHLFNMEQSGGLSGMDIGLQGVKDTGRCVLMAFVDGAVQLNPPDLIANVFAINCRLPALDPSPPPAPPNATYNPSAGQWDDAHGTAVVGIAVASASKSVGGLSVAPETKFVAYKGIVTGLVASNLRSAIDLGADIVNNSWCARDSKSGHGSYQSSDPAWRESMTVPLGQGLRGRGMVVVFAAGNGGSTEDSNRTAMPTTRAC
jgi:hypothetical protein